jgi:DNA modification methylase
LSSLAKLCDRENNSDITMSKKQPKEQKIKITAAKGRPLLTWAGKKPLDYVKGYPTQLLEVFDPLKTGLKYDVPRYENLEKNWQNLLFHGDNKDVLATLLEQGFRGKIDLVYIDPPFMSGADYIRRVELRGVKETRTDVDNADLIQQTMYFDMWRNDAYLQFMYERLMLLKELLAETGSIYVHLDWHVGHYVKLLMDEVFGQENFRNEIVWKRLTYKQTQVKGYGVLHDTIFYYIKGNEFVWNDVRAEYDEERLKKYFCWVETTDGRNIKLTKNQLNKVESTPEGRRFALNPLINVNPDRPKLRYKFLGFVKTWKYTKEKMMKYYKQGVVFQPAPNSLPQRKQYLDESKGMKLNDIWTDISAVMGGSRENLGVKTQKPKALLKRIVETSTHTPDERMGTPLVLDCFVGSGTAVVVAQELGRRWIGCDINKGMIQTTSKDLQKIILDQVKNEKTRDASFATYKVNNYDLQLLRTEAIELAVQHIGIQRTKTDSCFDGTLGKNLVKIIDFNHPFTLLDFQLIQDELKKRPNEDRNITIVCLGKELAIDPAVEEWNKKHPVNKIEVIELKTDKKYGNFLVHKPDEAKVKIKRKGNKAIIEILDFISPTIIERLDIDNTLFKTKIPDFRAMIDCVLIDTNYNGKTFHVIYSDVPEKKNDLIEGKYELEIPKKETTIAVKIIDMLGEEAIVAKEI